MRQPIMRRWLAQTHAPCANRVFFNTLPEAMARKLPARGVLWVSWPKRGSGVASGIPEDTVRALALPLGLVDVKVCAIDTNGSAL